MQRRARLFSCAFPLGAGLMMVAVFLSGAGVADALMYHRPSVLGGEWWRLLTGHWVHRSGYHLALNLAGLVLVWHLFGEFLQGRHWLVLTFLVALGQSVSLMFVYSDILWFEGLSGLLHGLLAAGAVIAFSRAPVVSGLVLAVLAFKLAAEAWFGGSAQMEALLGQPVLAESHWCGAIAGLLGGCILAIWSRGVQPTD
ncbi:rhombosortase [Marinobacter sp.]|uniref:rhombosortase n=1 Tax=Marinobacter sp. TaxID=50741 RepID=UPI003563C21D